MSVRLGTERSNAFYRCIFLVPALSGVLTSDTKMYVPANVKNKQTVTFKCSYTDGLMQLRVGMNAFTLHLLYSCINNDMRFLYCLNMTFRNSHFKV